MSGGISVAAALSAYRMEAGVKREGDYSAGTVTRSYALAGARAMAQEYSNNKIQGSRKDFYKILENELNEEAVRLYNEQIKASGENKSQNDHTKELLGLETLIKMTVGVVRDNPGLDEEKQNNLVERNIELTGIFNNNREFFANLKITSADEFLVAANTTADELGKLGNKALKETREGIRDSIFGNNELPGLKSDDKTNIAMYAIKDTANFKDKTMAELGKAMALRQTKNLGGTDARKEHAAAANAAVRDALEAAAADAAGGADVGGTGDARFAPASHVAGNGSIMDKMTSVVDPVTVATAAGAGLTNGPTPPDGA